MGIKVKQGGMLTMVQDGGRFGSQISGVSVTGAADLRAYETGNLLVGNTHGEACLETAMMGLCLAFTEANVIAVTGGDMTPLLNETPIPMYQAVAVKAGDELRLSSYRSGFRSYLCFAGGLDVPLVFGSRSTHLRCGFGGLGGRKLAVGDELGFAAPQSALPAMEARRTVQDACPTGEIILRAVPGPQDDYFTERGLETFFSGTYTATKEMDRLGARLEGPEIEHARAAGIISDGVAYGSVQVPANGQPIVMLADRQTTGGYTKIATVVSVDLPLLAQSLPGQKIRFCRTGVEEAQELYLAERRRLQAIKENIDTAMEPHPVRSYSVQVNGNSYLIQLKRLPDNET